MDNRKQGRDGQPLATLIDGLSNLSSTVDGISSRLNHLSEQFTSLHKQVNFKHNVEIDLDPNSIRNHLHDSVRNRSSRKTQLYFESESLLNILEFMIIDNYSARALSHVLGRARKVLAASWSSWSFIRKSTNATKLQSLAFPVDCPKAEPVYQSHRRIVCRKRVVKYAKSKKSSES